MKDGKVRENIFKNKNFTLLFFGMLVSNVAHILFNFAISLYVLRVAYLAYGIERAAMIQAVYLAVSGIILVLFTPFGGAIADRRNKVRIMYLTDWIRGLVIVGVAAFLYFGPETEMILIALFAMNVILSINSAFFNPAGGSLLRFIVKPEQIQQGTSYIQGSVNLQNIIGIILGGILYATLDMYLIFLINGFGYIFSAISEMFIRYHATHETQKQMTIRSMFVDIKEGIRYIYGQKAILAIIIMALFINFFISPMFSNGLPYFFEFGLSRESSYLFQGFLKPENWYSIITVAFSISAIIMSLILSTQKTKASYGRHLKIALTLLVMVTVLNAFNMIGYFTGVLNINFVLVISTTMMFFAGLVSIAFNVPIGTIIQTKVEPHQLGKVSSVMSVMSQALIPFAALIAGVLISQFSIIALYAFSISGMIVVNILYLLNKNANLI